VVECGDIHGSARCRDLPACHEWWHDREQCL